VSAGAERHHLDDYDRAAFALLVQAIEMQPNAKARKMADLATRLVEFLGTQSVPSFLAARSLFNGLDADTKTGIRHDAHQLALQLVANPDIQSRLEGLMTRLHDQKKPVAPSRPGLLGAINRT